MFKKIICSFVCIGMILSNTLNLNALDNKDGENFNAKAGTIYQEYCQLLKGRKANKPAKSNLYSKFGEENKEILEKEFGVSNINNFKNILQISNGNSHKTVVQEYENNNISAVIIKDEQTQSKLYYEWSDDQSPVLLIVNGQKFNIIQNGQKTYMISENGDKLLISETYYDKAVYVNDNQLKGRAVSLKDTVYWAPNDSSYSKDIGPMSTTNKSLIDVISLIGLGTGFSKVSAIHPIIGAISFVATGISVVGAVTKTFYIRYWRSYQLAGSLTRNKERWFDEIGCSNNSHVKAYTSYFNATRPGY